MNAAAVFTVDEWADRLPAPLRDAIGVAMREIRRTLRGPLLTLTAWGLPLLLTCGCAMVLGPAQAHPLAARLGLYTLLAAWSCFLVFIIPATVNHGLVEERREETWDLFRLTSLSGFGISGGFAAAGAVQAMLISSFFAPFCYLLWLGGGVGIDFLFAAILDLHLFCFVSLALAVSGGASRKKEKAKKVQGNSAILLLLWLMGCGNWFSWLGRGEPLHDSGIWVGRAIMIIAALYIFTRAAEEFTHASKDRSSGSRAIAMGATIGMVIGGLLGYFPTPVSAGMTCLLATLLAWRSTSEPDGLTAKQGHSLQVPGIWPTCCRLVLGPGAKRGWRATLITFTVIATADALSGNRLESSEYLRVLLIIVVLADVIARNVRKHHSVLFQRSLIIMIPIIFVFCSVLFSLLGGMNLFTGISTALGFIFDFNTSISMNITSVIAILSLISLLYALWQCRPRREPTLHLTPDHPGIR